MRHAPLLLPDPLWLSAQVLPGDWEAGARWGMAHAGRRWHGDTRALSWEEGTSLCGVTDKLPTEGIDLGFRMWRMGGAWRALVKVLLVFVGRRMEFAVDFIRKKIST